MLSASEPDTRDGSSFCCSRMDPVRKVADEESDEPHPDDRCGMRVSLVAVSTAALANSASGLSSITEARADNIHESRAEEVVDGVVSAYELLIACVKLSRLVVLVRPSGTEVSDTIPCAIALLKWAAVAVFV